MQAAKTRVFPRETYREGDTVSPVRLFGVVVSKGNDRTLCVRGISRNRMIRLSESGEIGYLTWGPGLSRARGVLRTTGRVESGGGHEIKIEKIVQVVITRLNGFVTLLSSHHTSIGCAAAVLSNGLQYRQACSPGRSPETRWPTIHTRVVG